MPAGVLALKTAIYDKKAKGKGHTERRYQSVSIFRLEQDSSKPYKTEEIWESCPSVNRSDFKSTFKKF